MEFMERLAQFCQALNCLALLLTYTAAVYCLGMWVAGIRCIALHPLDISEK